MDILQAAQTLRPGTAWTLRGDVLTQAEDGTPRVSVPSPQELQPVMASDAYINNRIKAYPSIGDQLDALWQYLATSSPASLPKAASDMLNQIQTIKAQYPKPANIGVPNV